MKILFVCMANRFRSRTAEEWFANKYPEHEVKSCGTHRIYVEDTILYHYPKAQVITPELLEWADRVYVFEKYHVDMIHNLFGYLYDDKIMNLYIDDIYNYNDPTLLKFIEERVII